jgi:hypothetical protein
MSLGINFRGQSIAAVAEQVKQELAHVILTRRKVIECCKAIFDAQDWEASPLKFYPKKIVKLLFGKDRNDVAFEVFADIVWEHVRVPPGDSLDRLPSDVLQMILEHETAITLGCFLQIGTYLHKEVQKVIADRVRKTSVIVFGAKEWKKFMGADVGNEPLLPANISDILSEACPFSRSGRTVAKTHQLMLIPETINGQPLNLNTLEKLFKAKFPNVSQETGSLFIWENWESAAKCYSKSRWALMTRDVIGGSKNKTFKEQQALVVSGGRKKYEVPMALEAATCMLLEYSRLKGKTHLSGGRPRTYTRCCEKSVGRQVYVGGFNQGGFYIGENYSDHNYVNIGIAPLRKFV